MQSIAFTSFYGFKPHRVFSPIFTKSDFDILRTLGSNKDIVVCKPDKGRGVVLLNRVDYLSKMDDILRDYTKFEKCLHADIFTSSLKAEDQVNRFIK